MDIHRKSLFLLSVVVGIASIIVSAISWARIAYLSLPCPLPFPIINTVTPLVGPIIMAFLSQLALQGRKKAISLMTPYLRYILMLVPFSLFVLSMVYAVPSELLSCSMESHWSHMFRAKDENAVRTIENGLHCCGFNSLHDRAWPFPSRDIDVRACETTLGYTRRCADPWQRHEQTAAGLMVLASLLNWILLHLVDIAAQQNRHSQRLPAVSDLQPDRARLLGGTEGGEEHTNGQSNTSYSAAE